MNSLLCYDFLDYLIFRYSPTYIATDLIQLNLDHLTITS